MPPIMQNENFFQKLLDLQEGEIVIFGDMNGVLDPKKDRSKKREQTFKKHDSIYEYAFFS